MKKRNEKITQLLDEINKALGDTGKSAEVYYLLKKQGEVSAKQKKEIIEFGKQFLESQRASKEYAKKYLELLSFIKQQSEISQLKQSDIVELEKRVLETQRITKENLLKLIELTKTLKIVLPKAFDVKVINSDEFPTEFRISNLDELPKPLDEIHIKQPLWLPEFFDALVQFIAQPIIKSVQKQTQNVNLTGPTDPKKAIAVRLSDGKRFYTAVLQAIAAGAESLDTVENLLQQILSAQSTSGNRYIVTTDEINTGVGEVNLCLIKNPSGSGKNLRIEQVFVSSPDAGQRTFRLYRNSTVSANGTALSINGMRTSQSASIALTFKSPTITNKGNLVLGGNFGVGSPLEKISVPFIILPDENLLVTNQSTADKVFLSIVWTEE